MKNSTRWWFATSCYFLLLVIYTVFSYALTAPNLILSSWAPYWNFQTWMWATFFNNRPLLTYTYSAVVIALWLNFAWLILNVNKTFKLVEWQRFSWTALSKMLLGYFLLISPLFLANTALSYDVFNYIFNAKMVMFYQANPHVKVALDFAYDDWTRFMHNTHTPAPYGYGWTTVSLLPYVMGMGKFTLTWLLFRDMSMVSLLGFALSTWWLGKKLDLKVQWWQVAVIFLNPLLLLEIIATSHNDLWMMVPALLAMGLVVPTIESTRSNVSLARQVLLSAALLAFSISIKLATLTLLPVWAFLIVYHFKPLVDKKWLKLWPVVASVALFVPLLTSRAQQFHPWYLSWVLVWLPLFPLSMELEKNWPILTRLIKYWFSLVLVLAMSSSVRYLPYFWVGSFENGVLLQQKSITWVPFIIASLFCLVYELFTQLKQKSSQA